jgi:hypothetical protein
MIGADNKPIAAMKRPIPASGQKPMIYRSFLRRPVDAETGRDRPASSLMQVLRQPHSAKYITLLQQISNSPAVRNSMIPFAMQSSRRAKP